MLPADTAHVVPFAFVIAGVWHRDGLQTRVSMARDNVSGEPRINDDSSSQWSLCRTLRASVGMFRPVS